MGFRRGLLLGLLVGLVGGVVSGEPSEAGPAGADGGTATGPRSLLDEARAAAKAEREATEARLERRFRVAKETGHAPREDT